MSWMTDMSGTSAWSDIKPVATSDSDGRSKESKYGDERSPARRAPPDAPTADTFASEARELLDSIARARKKVQAIAGLIDGTMDRYRERIDRLLRESEVDNWRQRSEERRGGKEGRCR